MREETSYRDHSIGKDFEVRDARNQYAIRCDTVNITNVTNVANVSGVSGQSRRWKQQKRHHRHHKKPGDFGGRQERPPKLFRFCSSCGVMDYDVASSMDSSRMCQEAANVIGYSARGLTRSVSTCARDFSSHASGAFEGLCEMFEGLCEMFG